MNSDSVTPTPGLPDVEGNAAWNQHNQIARGIVAARRPYSDSSEIRRAGQGLQSVDFITADRTFSIVKVNASCS